NKLLAHANPPSVLLSLSSSCWHQLQRLGVLFLQLGDGVGTFGDGRLHQAGQPALYRFENFLTRRPAALGIVFDVLGIADREQRAAIGRAPDPIAQRRPQNCNAWIALQTDAGNVALGLVLLVALCARIRQMRAGLDAIFEAGEMRWRLGD